MRGDRSACKKPGSRHPKLPWAPFASHLETVTDLGSPTRIDVALIESIMLWPDDDEWRARAALAAFVEFIGDDTDDMDHEALRSLQWLTRRADPIATLREEVKKERFVRGVIAGSFLHNIVSLDMADEPRTMEAVAQEGIAGFVARGYRISIKTFNNEIWPVFRTVAHFWGAAFKHCKIEGRGAFPCRSSDLREFLADAEAYRILGEKPRPAHPRRAVLRPNESVRLPAKLYVAPSTLL